jgi:hypothetical protein
MSLQASSLQASSRRAKLLQARSARGVCFKVLIAACALAGGLGLSSANATPSANPSAVLADVSPLVQVQYACDAYRCMDPRSGAYTSSNCNARGCYPTSGVLGYIPVPGGGGGGYRQRGYGGGNSYDGGGQSYGGGYVGGYGSGGGRFDCNPNRCIDTATGGLWESTCTRYGCKPLRPVRRNVQRGYWD